MRSLVPERDCDRYNVVLVVFDTLRKDALGCYEQVPAWEADFPPIATLALTLSRARQFGSPRPTRSRCPPSSHGEPYTRASARSPSTMAIFA